MSHLDAVITDIRNLIDRFENGPRTQRKALLREEAEKLLKQAEEIKMILEDIKRGLNGGPKSRARGRKRS